MVLLGIFCVLKVNAQDYLIIFKGTGASTTVSTVKVENLTAGISLIVSGNDILHLTAILTGVNAIDNEQLSEIKIYPNPMIDNSTLEFYPPVAGDADISVYDMIGKPIVRVQSYLENFRQAFRLSGLNNDFYIILVKGKNYQFSGKLISNGKSNGTISIEKVNNIIQTVEEKKAKTDCKGVQATVDMEYSNGDRLKFTSISGNYSTVKTDIPESDKTIIFNFIACTDGDDNNYPVVEIGTQVWMAENLKTSKYNDGSPIPEVSDNNVWASLAVDPFVTNGAFCWYNNDSAAYEKDYGKLYNFGTVESGKLCPAGWHVPTINEWKILCFPYKIYDSLGGFELMATDLWNYVGTNETGFTAVPGSCRSSDGTFLKIGVNSVYWSSTVACHNMLEMPGFTVFLFIILIILLRRI